MAEKIKSLIHKIKYFFSCDSCYDRMEQEGIAKSSKCQGVAGGGIETNYLSYQCISCPYFTLANLEERENNG